jgi:UDP-N-acetylmuramoylalanine--D-glutamate ligase
MASAEPLGARRVAVLGLGRSGLAIARAALEHGAQVRVYDRLSRDRIVKRDALEEAERLGVPIEFGWDSPFDESHADVVVTNPAVDKRSPVLRGTAANGVEVWSEIEFAYRITRAPIVAITGTNGKSTTTVMTFLCLQACGIDAMLCGNIFGTGYDEVPLTEAALRSRPEQVLVAEVSSFQLEWVHRFRPVAAAIINISPDHLDRYDSFEDYAATKRRIFAAQGPEEFAIVGADEPEPRGPRVLKLGREARANGQGLEALGRQVEAASLPFEEPHNLENGAIALLLAAATMQATGRAGRLETPECAVEGLRQFRGIEHRMEFVGDKDGVRILNNSMCTNPEAVVKSARSLRRPAHLLIGGENKGLPFDPLRDFVRETGTNVYIYGRDREEVARMLGGDAPMYETLSEAFSAAVERARPGEAVMLAPGCASTDQFRDFRHRGDVFKSIAKEWLNS